MPSFLTQSCLRYNTIRLVVTPMRLDAALDHINLQEMMAHRAASPYTRPLGVWSRVKVTSSVIARRNSTPSLSRAQHLDGGLVCLDPLFLNKPRI